MIVNILGMHALAGGMVGMAFQPVKWAVGLALAAFGADDEPYTFETAASGAAFDWFVQKGVYDITGSEDIARMVARGIPAQLGVDLSSRLSAGSLYMMNLRTDNANSAIGSLVQSVGGPWISIGVNAYRGVMDFGSADTMDQRMKAVEKMAPKFARDFFKAVRFGTQGLTTVSGDLVLDSGAISPAALFMQTMGLAPTDVTEAYEQREYLDTRARMAADAKRTLIQRALNADIADRGDIVSDVVQHNRTFPDQPIEVGSILKAMQNRLDREMRYRLYGANLNDRQIGTFGDEAEFLRRD
jgi:hypothetical protein